MNFPDQPPLPYFLTGPYFICKKLSSHCRLTRGKFVKPHLHVFNDSYHGSLALPPLTLACLVQIFIYAISASYRKAYDLSVATITGFILCKEHDMCWLLKGFNSTVHHCKSGIIGAREWGHKEIVQKRIKIHLLW